MVSRLVPTQLFRVQVLDLVPRVARQRISRVVAVPYGAKADAKPPT
jgi:hypothetical protein